MIQKETKRSLKSAKTKETIIAVGTKLMRRYGYENTSIQQICEMSGVSIGTFYNLFNSKHGLLEHIFGETSGYFKEINFDFENDDPFCLIDGYIDNHKALISGMSVDVVFSAIFSPPAGNKTMFYEKRSSNVYLTIALTGFQKAGKLRTDLSPELMCSEIGDCYFGVFYASYTLENMESFEAKLRGVLYRLFSTYLITPYLPNGY